MLYLDTCVYHVIHQSYLILLLIIWSWGETAKLFKKTDLSNLWKISYFVLFFLSWRPMTLVSYLFLPRFEVCLPRVCTLISCLPLRNWNVCGRPAVSLLQTCSKQFCLQRGNILVCRCLQLVASSLPTLVLSLANLQQVRRDWPWSQRDCKKNYWLNSVCNHIAIKIIQSKYLQEVCKDIASLPANQIPRFSSAMFPPVLNVWCV